MPVINHKRFMKLVGDRPGTQIVTITTQTEHKLKKSWTGGTVFKISQVNGMIGYNYENSVNNQLEREGKERDFQAESRPWGTRISPNFVEHKGNHYLTIKVEKTTPPVYLDKDGNEIDRETLRAHEYAKSRSSRQGTENAVIHREYKLDSILSINMNKETYQFFKN